MCPPCVLVCYLSLLVCLYYLYVWQRIKFNDAPTDCPDDQKVDTEGGTKAFFPKEVFEKAGRGLITEEWLTKLYVEKRRSLPVYCVVYCVVWCVLWYVLCVLWTRSNTGVSSPSSSGTGRRS